MNCLGSLLNENRSTGLTQRLRVKWRGLCQRELDGGSREGNPSRWSSSAGVLMMIVGIYDGRTNDLVHEDTSQSARHVSGQVDAANWKMWCISSLGKYESVENVCPLNDRSLLNAANGACRRRGNTLNVSGNVKVVVDIMESYILGNYSAHVL